MYRKHFLMEEAGGASTGASTATSGAGASGVAATVSITDPGSSAGGAGGSAGGGAGAATPNAATSWMDSLPPEVKGDPSLAIFKESGIQGLAKSWVSAQQLIGKDKVIIPGDKATAEEWATFHSKLGRPESPDKYAFTLPEGQKLDDKFAGGFKEVAFKAGLSPKQVQGVVEWYAKEAQAAVGGAQAAQATELKVSLDAYRDSLGGQDKFMAKVDVARQAVKALGDEKLTSYLRDSGAGSRPEMIEFFARLAGMMSEDKLRDGTGVPFGGDPADIEREIRSKEETFYKTFEGMTSFDRRAASEDILKLRERLESARQPRQ